MYNPVKQKSFPFLVEVLAMSSVITSVNTRDVYEICLLKIPAYLLKLAIFAMDIEIVVTCIIPKRYADYMQVCSLRNHF